MPQTAPSTTSRDTRAATLARVAKARRRRFQRYLDEMESAGCAHPSGDGFYSVLLDDEPAGDRGHS